MSLVLKFWKEYWLGNWSLLWLNDLGCLSIFYFCFCCVVRYGISWPNTWVRRSKLCASIFLFSERRCCWFWKFKNRVSWGIRLCYDWMILADYLFFIFIFAVSWVWPYFRKTLELEGTSCVDLVLEEMQLVLQFSKQCQLSMSVADCWFFTLILLFMLFVRLFLFTTFLFVRE